MKRNLGCFLVLGIIIAIFAGIGLIWGPSGYSVVLKIIFFLCLAGVWVGFNSIEDSGIVIIIICGVIAFASYKGSSAIDAHVEEIEQRNQEEQDEMNDYKAVLNHPTEEKCSWFLSIHPASSHYDEVFEMYYNCAQASGVAKLESFAELYGNTKWGKMATKRVSQICDSLYDVALSKNTVQGWREYQSQVTENHYADSSSRIEELETEAWSTDPKAWKQASSENTVVAYQRYMSLYPNGAHRRVAEKKIIDLQVDEVYASEHGELPRMTRTSNGGGQTSSVSIYNDTEYTLTVLYSGSDSRRVIIPSKKTGYAFLGNGTYRIAAFVDNPSVRGYAGSENLRGGDYSVGFCIVESKL